MPDIPHWISVKGEIKNILPIKDICEMLTAKFEDQEKIIEHLREKVKKLEDDKWKDKELQNMKEELLRVRKDSYRGFPISEDEYKAAINWMNKHEKEKHYNPDRKFPRGGAIGGSYTWQFTPTGIGTFGSIHCSCGDSFTFQEEA